MNRLLILSCSERKTRGGGLLRAIDRYDGPAFRVLRKYLRGRPPQPPTVLILSAKFGLIAAGHRIPVYNLWLSPSSARRMRPRVLRKASRILRSKRWHSLAICAGARYRLALEGVSELVPRGVHFDLLSGGQGRRLTRLRDWLHQPQPAFATAPDGQ